MVIKTGVWEEYNTVKFYDGDFVLTAERISEHNTTLPENWKDYLKDFTFDRHWFNNVEGIVLADDVKIRRARKLSLEKNDIFSLTEYNEKTQEKEKNLYIPAKLTKNGTEKQVERDVSYQLHDKTIVNFPIRVAMLLSRDITEEESNEYCKQWGGTHGIRQYTKLLDDGRYIFCEQVAFDVPYFTLSTYRKTVLTDFGKKVAAMRAEFKENMNINIDEWDMAKLLTRYDITLKKQGA